MPSDRATGAGVVDSWSMPTTVFSGLAAAASTLEGVRGSTVVVIDGRALETNRTAQFLVASLDPKAVIVASDGEAPLDLLDRTVLAAAALPRPAVVAVGGGLVMDVGRVAALLAADPLARTELRRRLETVDGLVMWPADRQGAVPVVCVPTTVGTGAEVSPIAVLRLGERVVMLVSGGLRPRAAVVEPELTASLPPSLLRSGLVEPLARVLVPAVVGPRLRPQDDLAAALIRSLLDLGAVTGDLDEVWRTTAAMTSAATHTSFVALGRQPFGHVLWPLAMEWATAADSSKAAALAVLLPAWLAALADRRVSRAVGDAERLPDLLGDDLATCVRRVRECCDAAVPGTHPDRRALTSGVDPTLVAAAVDRRWRAGGFFLADVPLEDVRHLLEAAADL